VFYTGPSYLADCPAFLKKQRNRSGLGGNPIAFKLPRAVGGTHAQTCKDRFDPTTFLAKVGTGKTILDCRKIKVVFRQGEIADKVFYIQKGRIKVVVLSDLGKEAVVGILEAGQFFGEGCLNGHPLRVATTTAMDDCVITAITKAAMLETLAVPAIYQFRTFAAAGGLVSYGTGLVEPYRLAGAYTARILKGEKPGDLPVQLASKVAAAGSANSMKKRSE
jgi:hypothetical protein